MCGHTSTLQNLIPKGKLVTAARSLLAFQMLPSKKKKKKRSNRRLLFAKRGQGWPRTKRMSQPRVLCTHSTATCPCAQPRWPVACSPEWDRHSPQMKHVVFKISSFFCFSLLRSAKVSMMTPKMRFRTMMMTMKKKRRS